MCGKGLQFLVVCIGYCERRASFEAGIGGFGRSKGLMNSASGADGKELLNREEDAVDTSDISELDDSFFKKAAFPEAELAKLAF
jgi:hypothetical protein